MGPVGLVHSTLGKLGGGAEHLIGDGEHALGGIADEGAHVLGAGLNAVGLHSAAQKVDRAGDQAAGCLSGIDTAHWTGQAAEAFRARYPQQPMRWHDAGSACASAAGRP
ncbi:MAG: putative T7SS-secreted protein [Micromonosporaceae bacterium]